jgi:hypothetical protein
MTCGTEYQAKALKEIRDDMLFFLEMFQDMKGQSAMVDQFKDWLQDMRNNCSFANTIMMTMCCFVFQIDLMSFTKLKTTSADVMWTTFRPMWEQQLQLPKEEQYIRKVFVKASDLHIIALDPIDLEKTVESYQTERYIVKEFTPVKFLQQ